MTVEAPGVIEWYDESGNFIGWNYAAAPTPAPSPVTDSQAPPEAPAEPSPTPDVTAVADPPPPPAPPAPAETPVEYHPVSEDQAATAPTEGTAPPAHDEPEVQALPKSYSQPDQQPPAQEPPAPAATPAAADAPQAPKLSQTTSNNGYAYNERSGYGIGWSNYNGDVSNTGCKSFEQSDQEWAQLADYDVIRIYGADCGQPGIALQLAKEYNKKVFIGIYWLDERLDEQIQAIVDGVNAAGAGWGPVDAISIGNEDVHRGEKSVAEVIGFVQAAKTKLRAAGYNGPVVHVDSQDVFLANPELCSEAAGDYIAANVHPFFNDQTTAEKAGDFVQGQIDLLRQCGASQRSRRDDVQVRVAEVGWPKSGEANGAAVPGKANQQVAIESIKNMASDHIIFFSAFDNKWMKDTPATFGTEQYWGILDG